VTLQQADINAHQTKKARRFSSAGFLICRAAQSELQFGFGGSYFLSFLWQTLQRTSMRQIFPHLGQRLVLRAIFNLVRGRWTMISFPAVLCLAL
jgi:hypothetical protein